MPGSDSWTTALSLGYNTKVVVLERSSVDQPFSQIEEVSGQENVSDNVSCVKTLYVPERKQIVTLFATFNGRLTCQVIKQLPL